MSEAPTDNINSHIASRVATALGQAIIDSISAEVRAHAFHQQLVQSREHLMELETDVANLQAQVKNLQPCAGEVTKKPSDETPAG